MGLVAAKATSWKNDPPRGPSTENAAHALHRGDQHGHRHQDCGGTSREYGVGSYDVHAGCSRHYNSVDRDHTAGTPRSSSHRSHTRSLDPALPSKISTAGLGMCELTLARPIFSPRARGPEVISFAVPTFSPFATIESDRTRCEISAAHGSAQDCRASLGLPPNLTT
jgi:hypothetical protein